MLKRHSFFILLVLKICTFGFADYNTSVSCPGNICFHLLKILFPPIENKFSHSGKFIFSEWEQMKIFYLFLIPTKETLAYMRLYI